MSWVPVGFDEMYAGSSSSFSMLDLVGGTWTTLASPPLTLAYWGSPALANGYIWELRENQVARYDITSNTWSIVRSDLHTGSDQHSMTVTDRDGSLWAFNGLWELVEYDPIADTPTYHATGRSTGMYETRVGYDALTHSIYFGGFGNDDVHRYDIATGVTTTLTPIPESMLNDIFCADHWGHLYAAGNSSGTTIWQYDILADTWARIPDYPVDHGNNGSCSVHQSGWLYVEPGSLSTLYRIALY
jgi:outer membrane protein assembly factor BamB